MGRRGYLFLGLLPALLLFANAAFAQQSVPHREDCTRFGYIHGHEEFGTSNTCDKPVVLRFMTEAHQRTVERVLAPGEVFDSGETMAQIKAGWWIFTTCPVGYASNIAFLAQNRNSLASSEYRCVRK
ncbi:MAG TPA: hypothetical protein VID77_11435 [Stellaceae bacterium]|jgi:hypothetical protein